MNRRLAVVFVVLLTAGCCAAQYDVVWLSPSGTDGPHCGSQAAPCLSLAFALQKIERSGAVILESGTYEVLELVQVSDKSFEMVRSGHTPAILEFASQAFIHMVNCNVSFDGIELTHRRDGHCLYAVGDGSQHLSLKECQFLGNSDNTGIPGGGPTGGIAVAVSDLFSVSIENCKFTNNEFKANDDTVVVGAAVYLTNIDHAEVANSTFVNNTLTRRHPKRGSAHTLGGAALGLQNVKDASIRNTLFSRNQIVSLNDSRATCYGGTLYASASIGDAVLTIIECTFDGSLLSASSISGGAVYAESLRAIKIEESRFVSNAAVALAGAARGGAISVASCTRVDFLHCNFSGSTVSGHDRAGGGHFHALDVPSLNLSHVHFAGGVVKCIRKPCTAVGGAACFGNCSSIVLGKLSAKNHSSLFESGGAGDSFGGCFLFNKTRSVVVSNSLLAESQSSAGGAVAIIRQKNSTLLFQDVNFANNVAQVGGGAIWSDCGSAGCSVAVEDCVFARNSASMGGALYQTADSSLSIATSVFEANRALHYGGAMFIASCQAIDETFSSASNFTDNRADSGGGVVAFAGCEGNASCAQFCGCCDTSECSCEFSNNFAAYQTSFGAATVPFYMNSTCPANTVFVDNSFNYTLVLKDGFGSICAGPYIANYNAALKAPECGFAEQHVKNFSDAGTVEFDNVETLGVDNENCCVSADAYTNGFTILSTSSCLCSFTLSGCPAGSEISSVSLTVDTCTPGNSTEIIVVVSVVASVSLLLLLLSFGVCAFFYANHARLQSSNKSSDVAPLLEDSDEE